jgi:hypothetical protein
MFKPVPLSKLEGQEFVPQAIIDRPTSHFAEALKIPFSHGHDDFDEYEAAAFEYLPYYVDNLEAIETFLRAIFSELNVQQTWISWRRSDDPTL